MKRTTAILRFIILALVLYPAQARAQTPTTDEEKPTSTTTQTSHVKYKNAIYQVDVDYNYRDAWPGNDNLTIKMVISTTMPAAETLEPDHCEPCAKDTSPVFSRDVKDFRWDGDEEPSADSIARKAKYYFKVGLKPDAQSRSYQIALYLKPRSNGQPTGAMDAVPSIPPANFTLFVLDTAQGLLKVDEAPNTTPRPCVGGEPKIITFTLRNTYVDYDVHVKQLKLSSNVDGLVTGVLDSDPAGEFDPKTGTLTFKAPLIIPPRGTLPVTVKAQIAGISTAGNYLTGYDNDANIHFNILYQDTFQRPLNALTYDVPLRVRPGTPVLLSAVLLGTLVGVVIMSAWRILRYEGSYLQKASLVGSTILIGLIVSVLAWQGQVNLSFEAVDVRASYDKPWVLFILSLFATVGGTPRLKKWLGLDKPGAGDAPAGR